MYTNAGIEIDVDGAWIPPDRVGYGLVIRRDGQEIYREGGPVPANDPDLLAHRQIGGEIYAVVQAVRWCVRQGVRSCRIYHDYAGLAHWARGEWKARTPLTQRYVAFLRRAPIQITWVKVPAHSGCSWNELADQLARTTLKNKPDPPSI